MNRTQIEKIAATIVEKFNPVRVVVFGSHVRGEAKDDSDLDLFLEMETDRRPRRGLSAVFGLHPWSVDVVVYTPAEVERLRNIRGTLLPAIETEEKCSMSDPESHCPAWVAKADNDLLNIQNSLFQ